MKVGSLKFTPQGVEKSVNAITFLAIVWLWTMSGCGSSNVSDSDDSDSVRLNSIPIMIKAAKVTRGKFYSTLQSNGKLEAKEKADLVFEKVGIVTGVFVQNGDIVTKGDLIALEDTTILYAEILNAKQHLSKAELEMEDLLLVMGYNTMDTTKLLVKRKKQTAYILSGIQEMKSQLIIAKRNLSAAKIKAPFDGIVAGLSSQAGCLSSNSEKVCTLISQNELWINFFILENEFNLVAIDDEVEIIPAAYNGQKNYKGYVKSINPKVEKNGLILVKALVKNPAGDLIDGMNVHLFVKKYKNGVIAIDKHAVQDRQGRNVVFTYVNGVAKWNYVTLGTENADSIEITKGLEPGDLLVLEGQINLGHDTEVVLAN